MTATKHATVYLGSNLDVLPTLESNSIDSIVTDPPYELGFMGKSWDSSGIAYNVELWKECLRVLKPGGHLLAFGGSRTWHRIAVAIEDSGFEIRDSIAWMYGSGFPKSLDVSKAIDKTAGAERKKIPATGGLHKNSNLNDDNWSKIGDEQPTMDSNEASTPEAQQWEGWGTALKPAFEPIVVARKPLIGTVAANVLQHGTGALNIDGSRIGTEQIQTRIAGGKGFGSNFRDDGWQPPQKNETRNNPQGRWPANVILDEYSAEILDGQSGVSKSVSGGQGNTTKGSVGNFNMNTMQRGGHNDTGGASRFFYCAKASKADRNEGLEELEGKPGPDTLNSEHREKSGSRSSSSRQNFHPTVKPTDLMRYLIKLVTPPGGTVLDPFTGSGSTGKAAILEGFDFIGIELTEDYMPIIEGRLMHAETKLTEAKEKEEEQLF